LKGFSFAVIALVVVSIFAVPSLSGHAAAAPSAPAPSRSHPAQLNAVVDLLWWDFGSDDILFDWSADQGVTWHRDVRVNDHAGSASGSGWQIPLPAMNVDQTTGAIYVAWPDSRNGNMDIYFSASKDGGQTWSANTRINDDTGSAIQYMVDLAIDRHGTVLSAWEDNRNGAWNIYYSNSTDGGQTWAANLRVSSQDTPGTYNRPGDYFAIEAGPGDNVSVVWTDGRGADFDIYYAHSNPVNPFSPNVRVTDGSSPYKWQVEPTMAVNRSGTIFAGWKETNGPEAAGLRVGASYSTDQGQTWATNILMNQSHPGGGCANSDAWMALAPDERVQYAYLEYDCSNGQSGLNLANTTNGQDWGTVHFKRGGGGLTDKDSITVAPSGRIYAAWDEGNVMDVTWSDDGGASWAPFLDPDDNPGGVLGAIIQTGPGVPVSTVTVTTVPAGLPMVVDGVAVKGPVTRNWTVNSTHTIGVSSVIPGGTGTRYVWASWSDGGGLSHTVVADSSRTIVAYFQKQYQGKVAPNPTGLSVLVDNATYSALASFWWNDGSVHWLEAPSPQNATPDVRSDWVSWSDGGARAHAVIANAPITATASFVEKRAMRVMTSPSGLTFTVDGISYSADTTFWYPAGSYHTVSVDTPQSGAPGVRYPFSAWSDGGAASHFVAFTDAMVLVASFTPEYLLTVDSPAPGTGGGGWYAAGTTVVATATYDTYSTGPGERLSLRGWMGDASGSGLGSNPIVMDRPKTAVANYVTQYRLEVTTAYGTATGSDWYDTGSTAFAEVPTSEVSLGTGSRATFGGWSGNASGPSARSGAIAMDGPKRATADWSIEYQVTVLSDVGTVGGGGWYPAGSTVTLQAPSQMTQGGTTYNFAGWTGDASSAQTTLSITLNGPVTVRATWTAMESLGVSGTAGGLLVVLIAVALIAAVLVWRRRRGRAGR